MVCKNRLTLQQLFLDDISSSWNKVRVKPLKALLFSYTFDDENRNGAAVEIARMTV